MRTIWKLLFPTNSAKILSTTYELASRRNIGGGFGAKLDVPFCFLVEFSLSNNVNRLFFKGSVSLFFDFSQYYWPSFVDVINIPCVAEFLTVPVCLAIT